MQHKTIAAQGGIVHYWINRKENTADCIVFTHGVTADHTMFEKQKSLSKCEWHMSISQWKTKMLIFGFLY